MSGMIKSKKTTKKAVAKKKSVTAKTILKSKSTKETAVPVPETAEITTVFKFGKQIVEPAKEPMNLKQIAESLKSLKDKKTEASAIRCEMERKIKEIEDRYAEKLFPMETEAGKLKTEILESVAGNADMLKDADYLNFGTGIIKKRESTELFVADEKNSIRLIGLHYKNRAKDLLRAKLELDKPALKKLSQTELSAIGLAIQNNINLSIEV